MVAQLVHTAAASVGERVCVVDRLLQQDKFARSVSPPHLQLWTRIAHMHARV